MPDLYVAQDKRKSKVLPTEKKEKQVRNYRTSPLSSFVRNPHDWHFETQEQKEKIVLFLRKHPVTNIPWIFAAAFLFLAPLLFRFLPIFDVFPARFQFVGILSWYLVSFAFALEKFLTWFFNVYIITDERIIDVDFIHLVYKEVSDAKVDKIQDVTYKMGGVIRTIFNYGDVLIQTAGEVPNFDFEAVPNPAQVVEILQKGVVEEEQEKIEGRVR